MSSQSHTRARSTEEMRELGRKAAAVLRRNGYQMEAAVEIGINEKTYYRWLDGDDEAALAFQAEVLPALAAQARGAEDVANREIDAAGPGAGAYVNWHKFKLERRYRKIFGDLAKVELTGKDGGPIQHQDLKHKPTSELMAAIESAGEDEDD